MKIAERQHSVKIEGDVSVNEFGFIFNAKMVQLLSDNLYNDKILAIVREISTNAYDSHVEAGTQQKPFDVHLPTYYEPYFYVRDYGTGMSPERVDKIYRFYGASDRTESNEFTGGMGLGSKVPFCYNTHTFTVESWHGGIHTCYSCFIGENGKPNIATMSSEASDKPSGVMIRLQVNTNDCSNFKYAAERVYEVFPTIPNFVGEQKLKIVQPKYSLMSNTKDWGLREVGGGDGCRVIMGNVAYPVRINDANVTPSQRAVMQSDFDLFAEVGTLSVDISREGLSYDNRTRTRISNMLNNVIADYNARIQEEIDKCKNLWEARKKFVAMYDKAELRIMDGSQMEYGGKKLFDRSGYHHVNLHTLTDTIRDTQNKVVISTPIVSIISISIGWRSSKYDKHERINSIPAKSKIRFYENDLSIGAFVRAAEIARTEKCTVYLFKFNDGAARKTVADAIGFDVTEFIPISTVPSPTLRGSNARKGTFGRVLKFDTSVNSRHAAVTMFWKPDQSIDFDNDSGYYVEFNRFQYRGDDGYTHDPNNLAAILEQAKSVGITLPDIYGIKTADIKYVKDNPQWINIFDYLKTEIAKILPNVHTAKIQFYQDKLRKVCRTGFTARQQGKGRISDKCIRNLAASCSTLNDFTTYSNALSDAQNSIKNHEISDTMVHLAKMFSVPMPKYPDFVKVDLDKLETDVYNKYAMLGFLEDEQLTSLSSRKAIAAYIDSIS